jgi:hypothetical protein
MVETTVAEMAEGAGAVDADEKHQADRQSAE